MQVETDTGQTIYTQVEPETGQTAYMQVEMDTGQTAYTLPSMTVPLPEEDRCVALLSVDHAVARQMEETSIESSLSMLQLGDTVDKLLPEQVYNFRSKPETEIESSEIPDPAQPCRSSCREEPLAELDMEIHGETPLLNEENSVHHDICNKDVPTRQECKGKAEVDAKAGATRHLPSGLDDATERSIYAPDAKADRHRHSTPHDDELNYRNDLNRMLNCRRIRLNNN